MAETKILSLANAVDAGSGALNRLPGNERIVVLNKHLRKNPLYDKIEVRYSPHKGVYMVALEDIKKGETVFKEVAAYTSDESNYHYFCHECKGLHCVWPKECEICCDPEAYEDIPEDEEEDEAFQPEVVPKCSAFQKFQRQFSKSLRYIADLKFEADYLKFIVTYANSLALEPNSPLWRVAVANLHRETKLGRKRSNNYGAVGGLIETFGSKFRKEVPMRRTGNDLLKILDTNCFSNSLEGTDLYPITALMEHSCEPNLECEDGDDEFGVNYVNAIARIKKGTPLCFSYDTEIEEMTRKKRRKFLKQSWAFECCCIGCAPKKRKRRSKSKKRRVKRKLEK